MNETFITKTDSNQEERLRALEGSYARRILEDSCARAPSIELTSLNQSRGNDLEEFLRKGMQTNSQQSNFPIMQGLASQCALYSCMQGFSSILSACRHVKIGGSQLKITRNTGKVTAARDNMYAPVMREYEINAKVLSSSIRVPFGLLQDSGAEILKIFTQENANTLANIMEGEIISGNSAGITGILNTPEVLTCNVDTEFDTQHLFALLSQLPAEHYHNKKWIMSRLAYNKLLLSENSAQNGSVLTEIRAHTIVTDHLPDSTPVLLGNFEAGYCVVESETPEVTRDPYSCKPDIEFTTTAHFGGKVIDPRAIVKLFITGAKSDRSTGSKG